MIFAQMDMEMILPINIVQLAAIRASLAWEMEFHV